MSGRHERPSTTEATSPGILEIAEAVETFLYKCQGGRGRGRRPDGRGDGFRKARWRFLEVHETRVPLFQAVTGGAFVCAVFRQFGRVGGLRALTDSGEEGALWSRRT